MTNSVLVLIVAYNARQYIDDCLRSVLASNLFKSGFDVLVVDNASPDNVGEYVSEAYPEVKLLPLSENQGFAGGNNAGIAYAMQHGYGYVYLLNQDTVVEKDFLQQVLSVAAEDPIVGAVQSKLLLWDDKTKINSIGNHIHYLGFAYAGGYLTEDRKLPVQDICYPSGAAVLLSIDALRQVGTFWPDFFMYHEDTDLGWRLWLSGFRCVLAPDSVVYHKYEFSRAIQKFYFMEKNRYLVMLQNYKLATMVAFAPAFAAMAIGMAVYSFKGGWAKQYWQAIMFIMHPLHWKHIAKRRAFVQARRKLSDRAVISRFTGEIAFQGITNPLIEKVVNPVFKVYFNTVRRIISW